MQLQKALDILSPVRINGNLTTELRASYTYLGKPLIQAAKSLVMKPASMVSIQTSSKTFAKKLRSLLLSSLALWAKPLVQAKMEAKREGEKKGTLQSHWLEIFPSASVPQNRTFFCLFR